MNSQSCSNLHLLPGFYSDLQLAWPIRAGRSSRIPGELTPGPATERNPADINNSCRIGTAGIEETATQLFFICAIYNRANKLPYTMNQRSTFSGSRATTWRSTSATSAIWAATRWFRFRLTRRSPRRATRLCGQEYTVRLYRAAAMHSPTAYYDSVTANLPDGTAVPGELRRRQHRPSRALHRVFVGVRVLHRRGRLRLQRAASPRGKAHEPRLQVGSPTPIPTRSMSRALWVSSTTATIPRTSLGLWHRRTSTARTCINFNYLYQVAQVRGGELVEGKLLDGWAIEGRPSAERPALQRDRLLRRGRQRLTTASRTALPIPSFRWLRAARRRSALDRHFAEPSGGRSPALNADCFTFRCWRRWLGNGWPAQFRRTIPTKRTSLPTASATFSVSRGRSARTFRSSRSRRLPSACQ